MLQQILKDMYVDSDILNELSDEQKQILFVKIREEQIRRWKIWDIEVEKEEEKSPKVKSPDKPSVNILLGKDKNEWVWVMGEHSDDKPIDDILENEIKEKARTLAVQEAEAVRKKEEEEIRHKFLLEQQRLEEAKRIKEEEIRRIQEEAEIYQSIKEARAAAQKLEKEKKKEEEERQKKLAKLQLRAEKDLDHVKLRSSKRRSTIIEKRSSQILDSYKLARAMFEKSAQESSAQMEMEWKMQEVKAKQAEEEQRQLARCARLEHRLSLKLKLEAVNAFKSGAASNSKPHPHPRSRKAIPSVPYQLVKRVDKPPNREEVEKWFKEYELPKGAGRDTVTGDVAEWFHGIINRTEAESLLSDKPVHSFLVRVSEKIWGYAISFKSERRIKHFLIDASDGSYQFFGTGQDSRVSLAELISFHKNNPVSMIGQEYLKFPCRQRCDPPDYFDLFHTESTDF